ncbi:hypothetical protein J6590_077957 [Homalodisca vitripennis]|nr:hypothetical protein J6590_077957 [Homalodisca vitripennis]
MRGKSLARNQDIGTKRFDESKATSGKSKNEERSTKVNGINEPIYPASKLVTIPQDETERGVQGCVAANPTINLNYARNVLVAANKVASWADQLVITFTMGAPYYLEYSWTCSGKPMPANDRQAAGVDLGSRRCVAIV